MKAIYLEDSYLKEFDARVLEAAGERVLLDQTAFYPRSGGQPSDHGVMDRGGDLFRVLDAEPSEGGVLHMVDRPGLLPGESVHAAIDWERRYRLMRGHTACHILSAVIFEETGAKITGNQIDLSRSRVDFSLESFDRSRIQEYIGSANRIVEEDRPVRVRVLPREEALSIPDLFRLAVDLPDREEVRVVTIEGIDSQACGGTHVRRTGEVGRIEILRAENKGKSNRRIYFSLED
ncbi:MAG: alanyl-tRNA editing protein AlaXM [Methanothrix sp.]|nr:alanyl-tRNA editing protein AlaXM [Methanothrix sp.]